ncbi:argininosuccinate synthetase [Ascosphaera pollenicola]|nr:argininosuccinate synthetase [Ascosphaera pollenicola]
MTDPQLQSAPGTGAVVPPAGITPTARERKYDRQLRLWAASGQHALESSRVLLINTTVPLDGDNGQMYPAGVAGVEALKNLVLPGVGGFTIIDHATVEEEDLGVNFFLEEESFGKNRGAETCRLLRELNPDVDGDWDGRPLPTLLADSSFISSFSLILLTAPVPSQILSQISSIADNLKIPLIYIHCIGFYGAFSLQLPSLYPIIETHPPSDAIQDLRLTNPWPELAHEAKKLQTGEGDLEKPLDELDDYEHGHVPWLLLLLHYLEVWKAERGNGLPPQNFKEKTEFREMVRQAARTHTPEGGEENFDEASAAVLKYVSLYSLPDAIQEIFDLPETKYPTPDSPNFFVIAHALARFVGEKGVLPLPGVLPDMKAKSQGYVRLQKIYKEKALWDTELVDQYVREMEDEWKRPLDYRVPRVEIDAFCKGAAFVRLMRGRKIPVFSEVKDDITNIPESTTAAMTTTMATRTKSMSNRRSDSDISVAADTQSRPTCHDLSDSAESYPGEHKRLKTDLETDNENDTPTASILTPLANLETGSKDSTVEEKGYRTIATIDEMTRSNAMLDIAMEGETYSSVVPIYIALKTLDGIFSSNYARRRSCSASHHYPQIPSDRYAITLRQLYNDLGLKITDEGGELLDRCARTLKEVRRSSEGELHSIAALIGGMVAQEGLKVLTRQYVPINNTVVFDGIKGGSGMMSL